TNFVAPLFDADPLKEVMIQKYIAFWGSNGESTECYNDVRNIEKMKKRPKIFQYDELDGIYERARKNRSLAYEHFKKVNMTNMNPKEMKFIFENLILTAPAEEKKQYQDGLDQLMKVVNESK
ncbi:MAG: hypothetical protein II009_03815, partial [Erysipelotrichaceae bacterium]|nr:hypothetical protein [Erysipelotrichaceae bacterium]